MLAFISKKTVVLGLNYVGTCWDPSAMDGSMGPSMLTRHTRTVGIIQ